MRREAALKGAERFALRLCRLPGITPRRASDPIRLSKTVLAQRPVSECNGRPARPFRGGTSASADMGAARLLGGNGAVSCR